MFPQPWREFETARCLDTTLTEGIIARASRRSADSGYPHTTRSWMADEKDPSTPKPPAPGAEPAAVGAPPTGPPDTAAAHPAGTAAGSTPPLPTPPMTPATGPAGVQAAPAPRSNAVSGVAPAAAAKPAPAAATSAKSGDAEGVSRRGFLKWTTVGWVPFSAPCTSGLVASTRFMFPNLLFHAPESLRVCFPSEE